MRQGAEHTWYICGMPPGPRPRPLAERFWEKVDKGLPDDCWMWTQSLTSRGYGQISTRHGAPPRGAHVVSYELTNNPVPAGMVVRHSCDNPPCVNPAHLLLGTQGDNIRDAWDRGRGVFPQSGSRGEGHGLSKLTQIQVDEIRTLKRNGWLQRDIASHFGVAGSTVSEIINGVTWREEFPNGS